MKSTGIVIGALMIVFFAAGILVLAPYIQLNELEPAEGLTPYSEEELAGRDIYIREGCVYCHSQQPRASSQAPDMKRGWGPQSHPRDYYYDYPHLLGTMRTGPDLFNIGARQPSEQWHLIHLFQPRAVVPWSIMPAYSYLFDQKGKAEEDDVVIHVSDEWRVDGKVIVAKKDALRLVKYLQKLNHLPKKKEHVDE